ncbi:MAG: hypothetical protein A3G33_01200 [Omnitrophica bacterium RIFCSPLOWO2_12_FULL_44_17]|uniref:DUF5666 domain-containing protein n=1 Tax=Candidatus Danuiimicrobium aquiferis TaxID=1801832 RepID=A0A1G1L0Z2_9BACT|nr:MAG: hypothetical protein A3B72_02515 [Omnitrophica bacterium RIFCSPHIGHO2_02_FULL_45_28]OGW91483.1 MAG: hypothetical protein A3E74_01995 [Omnitrophica bacterium RIFCSPHIGHO2_12_FULL_44_12]OGW98804.1 MAG: hypothetical protein A3G33_01200 [Omnitrophica bacterium RIFCSPLOWO2_12_FULL_44_17]OGX02510.1 MAG: hypothetical protein A3J12_00310 [Omnitrophica bacterium RIFCSPLOWO2_02_FULL_44_11]
MNQYRKWICKIAPVTCFFFIFIEVISPVIVFAQTAEISGQIIEIKPSGKKQFELTVQTEKGKEKFFVDLSTQVQGVILAKDIKVGQEIVVSSRTGGTSGVKGVRGMKSPFGDMASSTKRMLGLPDIPNVPNIPNIPGAPRIPKIPNVPKGPPLTPKAPVIPTIPAGVSMGLSSQAPVEKEQELNQSAQQAEMPAPNAEMNQTQAPQMAKKETQPEEKAAPPTAQDFLMGEAVKMKKTKIEENENAPEKKSAEEKSSDNSIPEKSLMPETVTGKVIDLKKTENGIEIKLAGKKGSEEKIVLPPEEQVQKMMTFKDLQTKMKITLQVSEGAKGKVVNQIVVA